MVRGDVCFARYSHLSIGNIIASSQREHTQYYPEPGFVEHDVEEIWLCTVRTIAEAMQKVHLKKEDILTIGITNQRETTVLWDKYVLF